MIKAILFVIILFKTIKMTLILINVYVKLDIKINVYKMK